MNYDGPFLPSCNLTGLIGPYPGNPTHDAWAVGYLRTFVAALWESRERAKGSSTFLLLRWGGVGCV